MMVVVITKSQCEQYACLPVRDQEGQHQLSVVYMSLWSSHSCQPCHPPITVGRPLTTVDDRWAQGKRVSATVSCAVPHVLRVRD
jgi:hypothetical protein